MRLWPRSRNRRLLTVGAYLILGSICCSLTANLTTGRLMGDAALGVGVWSGEPDSTFMKNKQKWKHVSDSLVYLGYGLAVAGTLVTIVAMRDEGQDDESTASWDRRSAPPLRI